ncbi:MAG TPA: protein-disulfide reductase DsbD domain-containing protein [Pyrinomonadaceae bacterium]|nr:protein-disulfide reductase DsbD domain-containing protein [Pyrinomonadaceae bacterium]
MKTKFISSLLCSLVLLAGCSADRTSEQATQSNASNTAPPAPSSTNSEQTVSRSSAEVVKVSAPAVEISAGGASEATIEIQVANGFHVNANPPTFQYLKATEVELQPANNITPGKPAYPKPVTKKFSFEQQPLAVYEGTTQIKIPLRAGANAQKVPTNLSGRLRVQACDDSKCYPPGVVDFSLPVTIR